MFKTTLTAAIRLTISAIVSIGILESAAHAEDFLSVLDDMPLAPGLTELADQAAEFETPAGRIIDAAATGATEAQAVSTFYAGTLPALGWAREGPGRFVRDQERLTIVTSAAATKGQVVVRFSVRPRDGAPRR